MPSVQQIKREFGSLNNAIIAAGLPVNKFVVDLSDEEMLELLRKKAVEVGGTPSSKEVDEDPNMPNVRSYEKRFGSYNKAAKKAGLVPNRRGASYNFRKELTDEDLLEQLRHKADELGRTPYVKDIDNDPAMASPSTFAKRFGSHNQAIERRASAPTW